MISDATRSTALNTPDATYKELTEAGCEVVDSSAVLDQFAKNAVLLGVIANTTLTRF